MASANFSSVDSLMSSAWFSIREIADFFVCRRSARSEYFTIRLDCGFYGFQHLVPSTS